MINRKEFINFYIFIIGLIFFTSMQSVIFISMRVKLRVPASLKNKKNKANHTKYFIDEFSL